MTRAKTYFTDKDPENIDILEVTDLIVTGITSIGIVTTSSVSTGILTASSVGVGTTSPQYTLDVYGDINFTSTLRQNGVPYTFDNVSYASTAGIATVAQGLAGTPNITVGIITAGAYVSSGTTVVYSGINTSTVDSNIDSVHYVTFNTDNTTVNISNFTSGKRFDIIARNNSGGSRDLRIRTSLTSDSHSIVPRILSINGSITNGTITFSSSAGALISIFNVNGTIVGTY